MTIAPASSSIAILVEQSLARVESRFRKQLATPIRSVDELCHHIERYRGKMLRPTLVVLAGCAVDPMLEAPNEEQVTIGTVLEMIHMATLVHDDVLDEAAVRRGGDTVNKRRGNEAAVILGDYLISKAFHLCSTLDSQSIALRVGEITSIVCEGEMMQLTHRDDYELSEALYFDIIERKTAALIAVACELGAAATGADAETARRFFDFGLMVGSAFQIQDDLLDLIGQESIVGKSLGKDLEKGKLTLPLIHYLNSLDPASRASAIEQLKSGAGLNGKRAAFAAELQRAGSIDYARATAAKLVNKAKSRLDGLPPSPARDALLTMADAVITRAF